MADLFARVGTFDLVPHGAGWRAVDTCGFNRWRPSDCFATREAAQTWAEQADAFKCGRRVNGPDPQPLAPDVDTFAASDPDAPGPFEAPGAPNKAVRAGARATLDGGAVVQVRTLERRSNIDPESDSFQVQHPDGRRETVARSRLSPL